MSPALADRRTLVLNADMQPLSWAPLSVWNWQTAFVAVLQGRVTQIKAYDDVEARSASRAYEVPSVVALNRYRRRKAVAFTRFHVFLRDEFRCQYCGQRFPAKQLTFDHVIPRSKGGKSVWTNIVACCQEHNLRKGSRRPEEVGLRLLRKPVEPSPFELDAAARRIPDIHCELHRTWLDFLYWDSELEGQ
jgi:5-methylcytosine-specific restriction endonuclease McrA